MFTKSILVVSIASIAMIGSTFAAERRAIEKSFITKVPSRGFQIAQDNLSTDCMSLSGNEACFNLTSNGGSTHGGTTVPDELGIYAPNVRVNMYMTQASIEEIANGGFSGGANQFWETTSPNANQELALNNYYATLPNNENPVINYTGGSSPEGRRMYTALVFGACDSLGTFEINHDVNIASHSYNVIYGTGSFSSDTIDSTGNYNMDYTIQLVDGMGGTSNFHVSGKVKVFCTADSSLY